MRNSKTIANEIKTIIAAGRRMNRLQNEGGEGYDHTADTSALQAEHAAAQDSEFATEWTAEVTTERRAAWNANMQQYRTKKMTPKILTSLERDAGYTMNDLKKAIALNK